VTQLTRAEYRDRGPRVGEAFPDIRLPDQTGDLVDLHQRRNGRPAVVAFNRSVVW
jgi:peroxiredoxin